MSAAIQALEQQLQEARQALQDSELRFRNIIERNADGILVVDREGVIRFVNRAAELLLGRTADELVGSLFGFPMVAGEMTEIDLVRRNGETVVAEMHITESEWAEHPVYLATLRNVNGRKQAEAEIRFQAQLLDAVEQAIIATDLAGTVIYWNRYAEKLYGWPAAKVIGRNIVDVTPAPGMAESAAEVMDHVRSGQSWSGESLVQRQDGSTFPAIVTDSPIFQDGKLVGILGVSSDITKQKEAEEALRESEERYQNFIAQIFEGIYRTEFDQPIDVTLPVETQIDLIYENAYMAECNQALADMYNLPSAEALIGTRLIDAHGGKDNSVNRATFRTFIENGYKSINDETVEYNADGQPVWFLSNTIGIVENGYLVRLWGTTIVITERKQAEEERERLTVQVREQARQMEQILASVPEGVLLLDSEGRVLHANPTAEKELTGVKASHILTHLGGRPLSELLAPPPAQGLWHEVKVGKYIFEVIARPVEPALSLPSELAHWVLVVKDVTRERKIQVQLQQQERLVAVGQLAAGIAHDFNNFLTPIIGYAQLGMGKISPDDSLYTELEQIDKAAARAADLTQQILAFSRRQILELQLLNLNEIIRDFEKMTRRLLRESIEIHLYLSPACGLIKADKAQIEQILMNLVINARDAMPGGGTLTIETANVFLNDSYFEKYAEENKPGDYVMMAVSDSGCGMDEETQKHIFEPFFTTKERSEGTGLGLATVFGIVKQHQGYIWVYSEPGQGTTFKLYLPLVESANHPLEIAATEAEARKGTATILVVEDEEMVRELICKTLATYGYNVLEANNALHALTLAEEHKEGIDLVLTDIIMPQMNGHKLYQQIVASYPNIKSLYMSGYTDNVIAHHGILNRGINFIQKPFTVQSLIQKVRDVLAH